MYPSSIYKKTNKFTRAFPAPRYLTMPAIGIDISDYAIKHIELCVNKGRVELGAYGRVDLPVDVIDRGEIKDTETIVRLLRRIKDDNDFHFAHVALPEEHAYLFQMNVKKSGDDELEQMIEFHLKENVPIDASEALFDYSVINETKSNYELNVSVYPASIAMQYISVVEEAGFQILSVEIEGQATARTLVPENDKNSLLIVDIGRNDASLAISAGGNVTFTANMETGGDYFTRAIARGLDISFQEAEMLKRKNGFCDTRDNEYVFNVLLPVISKFTETVHKHLMYWHMHMNSDNSSTREVSRVLIVGGNANIVGLAEYLEAVLGVPVMVGDVWNKLFSYEEYIPKMHKNESLEYTTAIGLALRSVLRSM